MNDSNKKKNELLGEPYGTANAKLRKAILFKLLQQTNQDICYRCKKKIESIKELSIEHKNSWMTAENPKQVFYDLDNISFSHLGCNCAAAENKVPHFNDRGENNHNHKLTWQKVSEIRNKLKEGRAILSLAKEYFVDEKTIWSVKYNITWKKDILV